MSFFDSYQDTQKRHAMRAAILGQPGIPAAPSQPGFSMMGAGMRDTLGSAAGGAALGGAFGGIPGALAGGLLGAGIQRVRMGTPSDTAQSAMQGGWDGFSPGGTAAPAGGSFPTPAGPQQALVRRQQQGIDADRRALTASQPQNVGQGLAALGEGINIAMRQRAQQQAAADPWAGMRETTAKSSGTGFMSNAFGKLFG